MELESSTSFPQKNSKMKILLLSLCVSLACATNRIRRSKATFDRRTGLPDTIRDTYSCIACNYLFEKVNGAEKFFTSVRFEIFIFSHETLNRSLRLSIHTHTHTHNITVSRFGDEKGVLDGKNGIRGIVGGHTA